MPAPRVEEVNEQLLKALSYVSPQLEDFNQLKDVLVIKAILAVGAEINMLRVALNTNSIDMAECINNHCELIQEKMHDLFNKIELTLPVELKIKEE